MDPTIPGHRRARAAHLTTGRFVDYGDRVVLVDRNGNTWAQERVAVVQGGFGFAEDGAQKLPRPYKFDATGAVVIEGDPVLIDFLDGNARRPVVLGGIRSTAPGSFLDRGYDEADAPYNRAAVRLRALSSSGAVDGEVRVDVHGAAGPGVFRVLATDTIEVVVADDLDTEAGALRITVSGGKVTIDAGGVTEPVILGSTFLGDLNDWLLAFTTLVTACGSATTAPQVAAAFAAFAASHATLAGQVGASVAAGAPHLSSVTRTQ